MNIIFWIDPKYLPQLQLQLDNLDESRSIIFTSPYPIHSGFVQALLPYKTWQTFKELKVIQ